MSFLTTFQPGPINGSASKTLGALTGVGTGTLLIQGAGAGTLADLTGTGTGTLLIQGTAAVTLDALTGAGTGTLAIAGTASTTLGAVTGSATGVLPIVGTGAATLGDVTGTATGTLLITGSASKTLDALTGSEAAILPIAAAGDATLAALTGSAAGASTITGAGDVTLDALTGSGESTSGGGEASDTLAARLLRAKGLPISSKGLPGSSSRRRRREIEGTASLRLQQPRVVATGEMTAPPEGELRGSVGFPLELRCRGVIGTAGRGRVALPGPAIAARVFLAPCGDARLILTPTVNARGWHEHFTEEEIDHARMTLLLAA